MRIQILSDIHDDYHPYAVTTAADTEILILAGDVGGKLDGAGRLWLERNLPRDIPVLLVPGNHDYYGGDVARVVDRFREKTDLTNVHVLEAGQTFLAGDVRFIGATLWTDYAVCGDVGASRSEAQREMTDFRRILHGRGKARPHTFSDLHARHRAAIADLLAARHDGPTVVITHHAPSARSLSSVVERGPLDGAYASDLEDLILAHEPDMWIHGHVHESRDYQIGRTRIVANPRGYVARVGGMGESGRWEAENLSFDGSLALQLRISLDMGCPRGGLVGSSPERPRDDIGGVDAPSCQATGDAADLLDGPADQREFRALALSPFLWVSYRWPCDGSRSSWRRPA